MFISVSCGPPRGECPQAEKSFERVERARQLASNEPHVRNGGDNKERSEIAAEEDFRALNEQEPGKESRTHSGVEPEGTHSTNKCVTHRSSSPQEREGEKKSRSRARENNSGRIIKKMKEDEEQKCHKSVLPSRRAPVALKPDVRAPFLYVTIIFRPIS
jgi:hypothetical protein